MDALVDCGKCWYLTGILPGLVCIQLSGWHGGSLHISAGGGSVVLSLWMQLVVAVQLILVQTQDSCSLPWQKILWMVFCFANILWFVAMSVTHSLVLGYIWCEICLHLQAFCHDVLWSFFVLEDSMYNLVRHVWYYVVVTCFFVIQERCAQSATVPCSLDFSDEMSFSLISVILCEKLWDL